MGILSKAFRVHPKNIQNPALYGFSPDYTSYTGVSVDEEKALYFPAVWRAVTLISGTVASLPLYLNKILDRGREPAQKHPLFYVMHRQPNPKMTSMTFRETQMAHLLLWGNSYAELDTDEGGQVRQLWPLYPGRIDIEAIDGEYIYLYHRNDGKIIPFPSWKILHIRGMSPDGLIGYNPVKRGRESISLALGLEEYAARFFGNGARPSAILQHPLTLSEPAKKNLRKSWEEIYKGLGNAHRIAILEEGMQLKEFSIDPEKAQALQSREFSVIEVSRLFGVPPHLLMDLTRATFSNIEEQTLEFVKYCIRPWLERIEQEYDTQLLIERERKQYQFKHKIEGLLRADSKSRAEFYKDMHMIGALSPNQIRELEDWNPIENGDEHFVQMNMVPLSRALEPPEPMQPFQQQPQRDMFEYTCDCCGEEYLEHRAKPEDQKYISDTRMVQDNFRNLILDAAKRIINRETLAVSKAIKKHFGQRNQAGFELWMEEFYKKLPDNIIGNLKSTYEAYAKSVQAVAAANIKGIIGMTPEMKQFIGDYLDTYTMRHIGSSLGQLRQLLRDTPIDELEKTLLGRMEEWAEKRADKIANDEVIRVANATARETFKTQGIKKLRWVAAGTKSCPFCQQLDGKVVGIEHDFIAEGEVIYGHRGDNFMAIKGKKAHPPIHAG